MIYAQLFLSFLQIGLFSIGGGYAAMPLIQSQVVAGHGWLTLNEFTDLVTIAEMTPGPIAINSATFVGIRIAGIPGALVSVFGCILPSLILVSALAHVYYKYKSASGLQTVLGCLRPAVVALICSAGMTILGNVLFPSGLRLLSGVSWLGAALAIAAFFVLRKFRANPIIVMLCCGGAGLLINTIAGGI